MSVHQTKVSSRALWLVVLTALALHLPAIGWGFFLDDHGQQLVFEGEELSPTMSSFNVFDFGYAPLPGDAMFESGGYPWWTSPGWKARFFRPLSSLSMALDQALFGRRAWLHHVTSLGLYVLVLLAAHRLYRRAGFRGPVLWLGVLILGCEDGSALVVGWIANRNTLLEALFGVLAVTAALDATRSERTGLERTGVDQRRPGLAPWLAVLFAALATLSKESGITALAVVALVLFRGRRFAAGAAAGALAAAHVTFLFAADYGVRAALYPTPWIPGGLGPWVENLAFTLAVQPLAAVSPFPVDLIAFDDRARQLALLLGLLLTPLLSYVVWRKARAVPGAGWLALWGWLNLLPQSLAPTSDRLVFVPALCFAPLVAAYIWTKLSIPAGVQPGKLNKVPAGVLALACLPLSALMLGARATLTGSMVETMEAVILDAELAPLEAGDARRDVLVLQYPNAVAGFSAMSTWTFETGDRNTRWFSLQFLGRGLEWKRLDDRRMDFTSLGQPFGNAMFESVFVDTALAPEVGDRWRAASFEVEALEVDDEGLRTVRVTWNHPMTEGTEGDPVILIWDQDRLARHPLPPVGEPLTLVPAAPLIPWVP